MSEVDADELNEFSFLLGSGMHSVPEAERMTFSRSDAEALLDRLDEFDAVRARGEVESRAAFLDRGLARRASK